MFTGPQAQQLSVRSVGVALDRLVAVPVDVGKSSAMAMVCHFTGRRLVAPFDFANDRAGAAQLVERVRATLAADTALVRIGAEACGHYHRPRGSRDLRQRELNCGPSGASASGCHYSSERLSSPARRHRRGRLEPVHNLHRPQSLWLHRPQSL